MDGQVLNFGRVVCCETFWAHSPGCSILLLGYRRVSILSLYFNKDVTVAE